MMSVAVAIRVDWLWEAGDHWSDSLIPLGVAVASGVLVFVCGSVLLKRPELHWRFEEVANACRFSGGIIQVLGANSP